MAVKFANNVSTTLSSAINATQTTISVADASGLPTLSSGDYIYLTIDTDTASPTLEVVKVTAISSNNLTVVRGQDGTTASSFSAGVKVELRVTAAALDDISSAADTESVSKDGDTMTGTLVIDAQLKLANYSIGQITTGVVQNEQANGYVRESILFSRDDGQLYWDSTNDLWTHSGGGSTDWSLLGHRSTGFHIWTGEASSAGWTETNSDFDNEYLRFFIEDGGNIHLYGQTEITGRTDINGALHVVSTFPKIYLTDTNSDSDFSIINNNGQLGFYDETNSAYRLSINSSGNATLSGDLTLTGSIDHASTLALDAATNITLDAGNSGNVFLQNNGTQYGRLHKSGDNWIFKNVINEGDLIFQGKNSSGTELTALSLDMSASGAATFGGSITTGSSLNFTNNPATIQNTEDNQGQILIQAKNNNGDLYGVRWDVANASTGALRPSHDNNSNLGLTNRIWNTLFVNQIKHGTGNTVIVDANRNLPNIAAITATSVAIEAATPILSLKDTSDNDDHHIYFRDNNGTILYEIATQNADSGDGFTFYSSAQEIVHRIGTTNVLTTTSSGVSVDGTLTTDARITVDHPTGVTDNTMIFLNADDRYADILMADDGGSTILRNDRGGFQVYVDGTANSDSTSNVKQALVIGDTGNTSVIDGTVSITKKGDFFPTITLRRTDGTTKTNQTWEQQIGSSGNYNLKATTGTTMYPLIALPNGDIGFAYDTNGANPRMSIDQSSGRITIDGPLRVGDDDIITNTGNITNVGTIAATGKIETTNILSSYRLRLTNQEITNFGAAYEMVFDANDSDSDVPSHGDHLGGYPFGIYVTGDNGAFNPTDNTIGNGLVKVWHTGHFKKAHIDYLVGLYGAGGSDGAVTATEYGYLNGVTSAIQTQLNAKYQSGDSITANNLTVTGDLTITGDINSYNVTDLDVQDKTITVNAGGTEAGSDGAGLIVDRGTSSDAKIIWDETADEFDFNQQISVPSARVNGNVNLYGGGSNARITYNNTTFGTYDWYSYQDDQGTYLVTITGTGGPELQLTATGGSNSYTSAELKVGGSKVITENAAATLGPVVAKGTTTDSTGYALRALGSAGAHLFEVRNDGVVLIDSNYLYVNNSSGFYSTGRIRARGGIDNDSGDTLFLYEDTTIQHGTSGSDPATLTIKSATEGGTALGDVYAALDFAVNGAETNAGNANNGVIAAVRAIDTRTGTGKTYEDAGLGFYTTPSDGATGELDPTLRMVIGAQGGVHITSDGVLESLSAGNFKADGQVHAGSGFYTSSTQRIGTDGSLPAAGNITFSNGGMITASDMDFVVRDATDSPANFIWRDHSEDLLYLGTPTAEVRFRSDVRFDAGYDLYVPAASKLYFGNSEHTYIGEDVDDRLRFFTGGAEFMRFTEAATNQLDIFQPVVSNSQIRSSKSTIGAQTASGNLANAAFLAGSTTEGIGIDSNELMKKGTDPFYLGHNGSGNLAFVTGDGSSQQRLVIGPTGKTSFFTSTQTNQTNNSSVSIGQAWLTSSASFFVNGFSRFSDPLYISEDNSGSNKYVGIDYQNGKITATGKSGTGVLNAFDAGDGYYVGNTQVISSSRSLNNITGFNYAATNSNQGAKFTITDNVSNQSMTGVLIDYNASGSQTHTGDNTHNALSIDFDSSATGGDTNHEHRIYGINSNVRATGDSDIITSVYGYAEGQNSAGQISEVIGVYGYALDDAASDGRVVNVKGVQGLGYLGSDSTQTSATAYGGYFKALALTSHDKDSGSLNGVYAEVEIDDPGQAQTVSNVYAVQAQIDYDGGGNATVNNGYLFYGNYAGTLPNSAYGIYIADAVRNYFAGHITTGDGDTTNVAYGFNGDVNTGMYSPGDHQVGLAANGSRKFYVDGNNHVAYFQNVNKGVRINGAVTNEAPITDELKLDGYGVHGNRGTVYLTNSNASGSVQIGVGGTHNANPKLVVGANSSTFNHQLTISDASDYALTVQSTDAYAGIRFLDPDDNGIIYYHGNTNHFYLHDSSMSINGPTIASGNEFQVNGAANVTGVLTWNGGSSTNANTAYSWGNHASAGYATTFDSLSSKTSGTGDYSTTGDLVAGRGSGSIALTINDGKGNSNVTFNHQNGVPDQNGNAARIEVNTDSSSGASMFFEVKSGVTGGTSVDLTPIFRANETGLYMESGKVIYGSGGVQIQANDVDFVLQDSTDGTTNIIWRDHSASKLYLGTPQSPVEFRSDITMQSGYQIFMDAGSASNPSITFSGDPNTGFFSAGADLLAFSTGGARRGYFASSGIHSDSNVYTGTTGSFRNYGGTWYATTGQTGNGFKFENSVDGLAATISSTGGFTGNSYELDEYSSGTVPISVGKLVLKGVGKTGWGVGDEHGSIDWYNSDGSGIGARTLARIVAENNSGNGTTTTTFEGELAFYTSPYNGTLNSNPSLRLHTNNDAQFFNNLTVNGDITVSGNQVITAGSNSRVKFSVWSGTTYGIGMHNGVTAGGINNDYAMTFQMNSDNDRGWLWLDSSHGLDEGAMTLTTQGHLNVANATRIGFGETDTTKPNSSTAMLNVNGTIASGAITATGASSFTDLAIGGAADSSYDLKVYGLARFEGVANFINNVQVGGTTVINSSRQITASLMTVSSSGTPTLVLSDTGNAGGGGASGKLAFSNTGGVAMAIGYTSNSTSDSDMIISTNAAGTYGGYLGLAAAGITDAQADIILEPKTDVRVATGDLKVDAGTIRVKPTAYGNYFEGESTGSSTNTSINLGYTVPYGGRMHLSSGDTGLQFYTFMSTRWIGPCNNSGTTVDNAIDLGQSTARFDDVYATNGTIQTSDRNEKQDIQALTDAEQRVATACKGLIRRFRWVDSVAEKGDDARYHFGAIAQDVEAAFTAEGLDAGDYGLFIRTTWWEHEGEDYPTAEAAPTGAVEKTRLGIRYNQLFAFIISAL